MEYNHPSVVYNRQRFCLWMNGFGCSMTIESINICRKSKRSYLSENPIHILVSAAWSVKTCNIRCNAVKV